MPRQGLRQGLIPAVGTSLHIQSLLRETDQTVKPETASPHPGTTLARAGQRAWISVIIRTKDYSSDLHKSGETQRHAAWIKACVPGDPVCDAVTPEREIDTMSSHPDELPSHASPIIHPQPRPSAAVLQNLNWDDVDRSQPPTPGIPDNLISPAFTPPLTPGTPITQDESLLRHLHKEPQSTPVDTSKDDPATVKQPRLVERLPKVECMVRARIPTTSGTEMFLHLYMNDTDNKEHLAIVFGNTIRSRSLDAEKPGETEMDRMIRGAYVGRLRPGRVSSRLDDGPPKTRRPMSTRMRSGSALKNVIVPDEAAASAAAAATTATAASTKDSVNPEPALEQGARQDSQTLPIGSENGESISTMPVKATAEDDSTQSPQQTSISARLHESNTHPSSDAKGPLVRIHSECYTGETAWSARCDCGEQLDEAARLMSLPSNNPHPGGVIVYLRQEGRGIGLASKLKAYNLQDLGNDTVEANLLLRHPADARSYGLATAILQDLGLGTDSDATKPAAERGIRLLTNNPDKVRAVEGPAKEVKVVERVAMVPLAWTSKGLKGVKGAEIEKYLETKIGRMGHMLDR